ncbi:hypothetical protein [Pinibacter aurantiacus]|uniref:Uncharacterized protein n=1 Tax=Pinibacter aurantiacus TaxID=2851599 RepID=A0A9E2SF83_9BACT|nr:hypothetical protein [Pinibacter aurantiacus]MBV4359065.1 hypothetical protein [Pinibacter aurantiacus]
MKAHNGMRPQDIVVLLKIIALQNSEWQYRDLSATLSISVSEISESLNRSSIAGLIDPGKRKVYKQSFMEFIQYGLHYVFPQVPGSMLTGVGTAHSHPLFKRHFKSEYNYVWPSDDGNMRGLAIEPLHKGVPDAAQKDALLYELLASVDVIRVGKSREIKFAIDILQKNILQ